MIAEQQLEYAGESSTFKTDLKIEKTGRYELQVLAMDGPNANFGMVTTAIGVEER